MTISIKRTFPLLSCAVVWALASCTGTAGDEWDVDLGGNHDEHPRYDNIRSRLAAVIRTADSETHEISAQSLAGFISLSPQCQQTNCAGASNCGYTGSCGLRQKMCVVNTLLEIIESPRAEPYDFRRGDGFSTEDPAGLDSVLVLPQDSETNAELARVAYGLAWEVLVGAAQKLQALPPSCEKVLSDSAALFGEAYYAAHDAAHLAEIASLAVSDAQYSRLPEIADAADSAMNAPAVSRSAVAHLLVGGDFAREGSVGIHPLASLPALHDGLCGVEPLSPEALQALALLRMAAPSVHSLRTATAENLLDGLAGGDVARRLAHELREPALDDLSADGVVRNFGLSLDSFRDAQAYLVREATVFARADAPQSTIDDPFDNGSATISFYSTRQRPIAPPSLYYSSLAAADDDQRIVSTRLPPNNPPDAELPIPSSSPPEGITDTVPEVPLVQLTDSALTWAHFISRRAALPDAVRAVSSALLADALPTRPSRVLLCDSANSPSRHVLRYYAYDGTAPTLAIAVGARGLSCAVRGAVDGVPCTAAEPLIVPLQPVPTTDPLSEATGFPFHHLYQTAVPTLPSTPEQAAVNPWAEEVVTVPVADHPEMGSLLPLFVVRLRPGLPPGVGHYEQVAGMAWPLRPASSAWTCMAAAEVPSVRDRAAEILAPDESDCSRPEASCVTAANGDSIGLIPLENELTSDGDGVESSWRHYISLAQQAADYADGLGEQVIENGLAMDLRAEAAIDELESICGVGINLTSFDSVPLVVTRESGGSCPGGYREDSASTCVLDPTEYAVHVATQGGASAADAARLRTCLSLATDEDDQSTRWVAAGTQPVCIWYRTGNPTEICEDSDTQRCPYEFPAAPDGWEEGDARCTYAPPGHTAVDVPTWLGLFQTPSPDDPPLPTDPSPFPCDHLAYARAWLAPPVEPNAPPEVALAPRIALEQHPFFDPVRLRALGERINWEPTAGNFSRVLWDGSVRYSTGSALQDESEWGSWPCAPAGNGLCPDGRDADQLPDYVNFSDSTPYTGPLFCLQNACRQPGVSGFWTQSHVRRARMNDMLARAVLAARIVTGASLEGMRMPYSPRIDDDDAFVIDDPARNWISLGQVAGIDGEYLRRERTGTFHTYDGDHGGYNRSDATYSDMGVVAEEISGTDACPESGGRSGYTPGWVHESVDWMTCPWDMTIADPLTGLPCLEVIDGGPDLDDFDRGSCRERDSIDQDRDNPLFIRTLTDASDGSNVDAWVRSFWSDTGRELLQVPAAQPHRLALRGNDAALDEGTRYFQDRGCGREGRYNECLAAASGDFRANWHGNRAYIGGWATQASSGNLPSLNQRFPGSEDGGNGRHFGLTRADVLNGLELLCALAASDTPGPLATDCAGNVLEVNSMDDVFALEGFLECRANEVRRQNALSVIRDLPPAVVRILREGSGGSYGGVEGEYGAAVSELAAAYTDLRDANAAIADAVEQMGREVGLIEAATRNSALAREIESLQLESTKWDRITAAIVATTQAAGSAAAKFGITAATDLAAAAAQHTNSIQQVLLAEQISRLRQQQLEIETELAFINFDTHVSQLLRTLAQQQIAIEASRQRMDAAQARIRNLQRKAQRAVARALLLESGAVSQEFNAQTVFRRRYNTGLYRYREAHARAQRLAYVAKLALEQRLGMRLSSMSDDLITVAAPQSWEGEICTIPTIDYGRIREGTEAEFGGNRGYAAAYLGDYVRRLEQVFESYNFAYPFQEGTDTAVISLRDDMARIRESCEVEVPNLLFQASHLDAMEAPPARGWVIEGCSPRPPAMSTFPDGTEVPDAPPACIEVTRQADVPSPVDPRSAVYGRPASYRLRFGSDNATAEPALATQTVRTALSQWVEVNAGRYRISWLTRGTSTDERAAVRLVQSTWVDTDGDGEGDAWDDTDLAHLGASSTDATAGIYTDAVPLGACEAARTVDECSAVAGCVWSATAAEGAPQCTGPATWRRHYFFADVPSEGIIRLLIQPVSMRTGSASTAELVIAAPMVEDISGRLRGSPDDPVGTDRDGTARYAFEIHRPGTFYDTTSTRTRRLDVCEDVDGSTFRDRVWSYNCVRVCPDGYDGTCGPEVVRQRCYYETTVDVSSDALQWYGPVTGIGFASGNYNYRIEAVGVNLVGTGVRDCSGLGGGSSSCYASGNVSYSLLHRGPFLLRNARGAPYEAPLFSGRIESARALAAERYITNPISSTDRALLEPYTRNEFRGRPLGGVMHLRIWDENEFDFEKLEDVQLVLTYRYWQHQR